MSAGAGKGSQRARPRPGGGVCAGCGEGQGCVAGRQDRDRVRTDSWDGWGSGRVLRLPSPLIPQRSKSRSLGALPPLTLLQDAPKGLAVAGAIPAAETELELALSHPKPGAPG